MRDAAVFKVACGGLWEGTQNLGEVRARVCTLVTATAEWPKHSSPFSSCAVTEASGRTLRQLRGSGVNGEHEVPPGSFGLGNRRLSFPDAAF